MLEGLEDETFANPLNDKTHPLDRSVSDAAVGVANVVDTLGMFSTSQQLSKQITQMDKADKAAKSKSESKK